MRWCAVVPGGSGTRTDSDCIGMSPWARCSSRASMRLLAFAVTAVGELVAEPAGAASVAVVPAHGDLVLGTPARVVCGRVGEALGFWRLGRRRRIVPLRALAIGTGGLRLHG